MSKKTGKAAKSAAKVAKTAKDKAARSRELKRQRDARYRAKKRQEKANAAKDHAKRQNNKPLEYAKKTIASALNNAPSVRIDFVVGSRFEPVHKVLKDFVKYRVPSILKEIVNIATFAYNGGRSDAARLAGDRHEIAKKAK